MFHEVKIQMSNAGHLAKAYATYWDHKFEGGGDGRGLTSDF